MPSVSLSHQGYKDYEDSVEALSGAYDDSAIIPRKPRSFKLPLRSKSNDLDPLGTRSSRKGDWGLSRSHHTPRQRPARRPPTAGKELRRNLSTTSTASTFSNGSSVGAGIAMSGAAAGSANASEEGITTQQMELFNRQASDEDGRETMMKQHSGFSMSRRTSDSNVKSGDSDELTTSSNHGKNAIPFSMSWFEQRQQQQRLEAEQQISEAKEGIQSRLQSYTGKLKYFGELCVARYEMGNKTGACVTLRNVKSIQRQYIHTTRQQHAVQQLDTMLMDGEMPPKHVCRSVEELLALQAPSQDSEASSSILNCEELRRTYMQEIKECKNWLPTVDLDKEPLLPTICAKKKPNGLYKSIGGKKSSTSSLWSANSVSTSSLNRSSNRLSRMFSSKGRLSSNGTVSTSTTAGDNPANVGTTNATWGAAPSRPKLNLALLAPEGNTIQIPPSRPVAARCDGQPPRRKTLPAKMRTLEIAKLQMQVDRS